MAPNADEDLLVTLPGGGGGGPHSAKVIILPPCVYTRASGLDV